MERRTVRMFTRNRVFVNIFLAFSDPRNSVRIINFYCDEAIASEQPRQDLEDLYEVIASEQDLVADFDLSLLDV